MNATKALMVRSRAGRQIIVIGPNVFWDPEVFGVTAEDVMPHARTFATYRDRTFFLKEAFISNFLDAATSVEIEAEIHRRAKNV